MRTAPLNAEARKTLSAWLVARPADGPPTLFSGQRGDPLSPRAVQRIIAKYARLANLESVSPHTLRHSFGKNLVNAGVTLEKVAMLMGHESLDTTRIYIVPSANDLANAVERLAG